MAVRRGNKTQFVGGAPGGRGDGIIGSRGLDSCQISRGKRQNRNRSLVRGDGNAFAIGTDFEIRGFGGQIVLDASGNQRDDGGLAFGVQREELRLFRHVQSGAGKMDVAAEMIRPSGGHRTLLLTLKSRPARSSELV